ncbi:hypothetical protein B0H13DRAFT_1905898 [Mycena leptocephala]|nr:hypothetical protein B0H13DRAFT_1905898 [Mycena leptocephala]
MALMGKKSHLRFGSWHRAFLGLGNEVYPNDRAFHSGPSPNSVSQIMLEVERRMFEIRYSEGSELEMRRSLGGTEFSVGNVTKRFFDQVNDLELNESQRRNTHQMIRILQIGSGISGVRTCQISSYLTVGRVGQPSNQRSMLRTAEFTNPGTFQQRCFTLKIPFGNSHFRWISESQQGNLHKQSSNVTDHRSKRQLYLRLRIGANNSAGIPGMRNDMSAWPKARLTWSNFRYKWHVMSQSHTAKGRQETRYKNENILFRAK